MPNLLAVEESQTDQKIFLQVIRQLLPIVSRLDDERLVKKIGVERFRDGCDELFGFIETGVEGSLTRLEKDALASKILSCLKYYMNTKMNLSFTLKTCFDCISLVEVATDEAFPFYHRSKMLRYAIR